MSASIRHKKQSLDKDSNPHTENQIKNANHSLDDTTLPVGSHTIHILPKALQKEERKK